jgi:peptidoglycan hydrolase-like protein with peptidoglycan-binding domain
MSQEVLEAQQWLNSTFGSNPDYIFVEETGLPGTATSLALVSALQITLNLPSVTGYFGDMTYASCDANPLSVGSTGNRVKILQHGLYCKGYDAVSTDGVFTNVTEAQLVLIQTQAGLSANQIQHTAYGRQMKAVLGVDEYVLVSGGDSTIRSMQQFLNAGFLQYIGLRPCDGIYSRDTNQALIYALQAEEGLPVGVANGNFGPTTQLCCPTIPYSGAETDYNGNTYPATTISKFILLFQYMLYCNGSKYDPGAFNGLFDSSTIAALNLFQADAALPVRDLIGLNEWMSLLVSTGNPNRPATACDCSMRLTATTAAQLKIAHYDCVGRYLTGDIVVDGTRVAKNLLRTEMKAIFEAGLSLFLIFQDPRQFFTENPAEIDETIYNYYTQARGYADAEKAFSVCRSLGVPYNEIIYFTADYDFTHDSAVARVIPYFAGINDYANSAGNRFRIGIYASRHVCTLVKNAGYSESSFVADLSTGYSGNAGFPLPDDWAFDQIQETSSVIDIAIDKDVRSGRYVGFSDFIDTDDDDEWDAINANGWALVNMPFYDASPPAAPIPVYWAKVKDSNDNFSVKYPMYDYILPLAFFSYRYGASGFLDDHIRYVYFRDVGGRLNAGYIDTTELDAPNFYFFNIYRNADTGESYIVFQYPTSGDYLLTRPVKYVSVDDPDTVKTLPAGCMVRIDHTFVTGKSYPQMLQVYLKKEPGQDDWEPLVEGSYGFVDLDFEHGVLPSQRTWITEYIEEGSPYYSGFDREMRQGVLQYLQEFQPSKDNQ